MQIFYCDPCGDERSWPRKMIAVHGFCQVCGEEAMGSQIHRDLLPQPEQIRGQLHFKFPKSPEPEEA